MTRSFGKSLDYVSVKIDTTKTVLSKQDLERIVVFRNLSSNALDDVKAHIKGMKVPAHTEIVSYLDSGQNVYFIVSGQVRVDMIAINGRQITYQILDEGEMFGELAAIDGQPRVASVVSETECTIAELGGREFMQLVQSHADLAVMILQRVANLSRWLTGRIIEYHAYPVRGRIYLELMRSIDAHPNTKVLKISDRDMASRVGTTRENVTKIYGDLKRDKVIERDKDGIKLLNKTRLQEMLTECEFS